MGNEYGMGSLAMMIFWGLIGTLIFWLIYTLISSTSNSKSIYREKNAQEINEWRFKQGEIDQKEYERKRDLLL